MNNELDELIRDLTKVGSIPKSEARRRIEALIERAYADGYNYGVSHGLGNREQIVAYYKRDLVEKVEKMKDEILANATGKMDDETMVRKYYAKFQNAILDKVIKAINEPPKGEDK